MSGFRVAQKVEARGMALVLPWLRGQCVGGGVVVVEKGPSCPWLQKYVGDVVCQTLGGKCITVECKFEEKTTGNLFLETWSNKARETKGWMYTTKADLLLYGFLDQQQIHLLPMRRLQRWFEKCINDFREIDQSKYDQLNDTWGRIVPVQRLNVAGLLKTLEFPRQIAVA